MDNAQLNVKIVFWQNSVSGQIVMGLPEQYPAPRYYSKIVCHTARDAERWSQKLREQEAAKEAMVDEDREAVEGELLRNLRSHMHHQIANARNNMNRDFLKIFLERQEGFFSKTKFRRESYLHSEGYEQRK